MSNQKGFWRFALACCAAIFSGASSADTEAEWVKRWDPSCKEVQTWSGRVDCVRTHEWGCEAIEADFALPLKTDEAIGQAGRYAAETHCLPAVLLIVLRPEDCKYVEKLHLSRWGLGASFRLYTIGERC